MSLIDRYVYEVGRHLPRKNRADIQAELRSSLVDALEDRMGPEPSEAQIAAFLQEFGAPKQVAASYHPDGQYLIGPALFPLFRLVIGITLAATLGAQVLAWLVAVFIAEDAIAPLDALAGLLNSIPAAIGTVVIVFAILQWFGVRTQREEETWDPQSLPQIDPAQTVKRGERIFGMVLAILILVLLVFFPEYIGFVTTPGGEFYANPVIPQYLGWITLSLLIGIGLDLYLVWQGRWSLTTRILKIGSNLLSIAILALLVQGHSAWLAARGASGFIPSVERFAEDVAGGWQLLGMQGFRIAFAVALIVTAIETLVMIYRLVRGRLIQGASLEDLPSIDI